MADQMLPIFDSKDNQLLSKLKAETRATGQDPKVPVNLPALTPDMEKFVRMAFGKS